MTSVNNNYRFYQFLQNHDLEQADADGNGAIELSEFQQFLKDSGFDFNALKGYDGSNEDDLVKKFFNSFDNNNSKKYLKTNSEGEVVTAAKNSATKSKLLKNENNKYVKAKGALDTKEQTSMQVKIMAYNIVADLIENTEAPDFVDEDKWTTMVTDGLMALLEKKIGKTTDESKIKEMAEAPEMQEKLNEIAARATVELLTETYCEEKFADFGKKYGYDFNKDATLQGMINNFTKAVVKASANVDYEDIQEQLKELIDNYVATVDPTTDENWTVYEYEEEDVDEYREPITNMAEKSFVKSNKLNPLQKAVLEKALKDSFNKFKTTEEYKNNKELFDKAIADFTEFILKSATNSEEATDANYKITTTTDDNGKNSNIVTVTWGTSFDSILKLAGNYEALVAAMKDTSINKDFESAALTISAQNVLESDAYRTALNGISEDFANMILGESSDVSIDTVRKSALDYLNSLTTSKIVTIEPTLEAVRESALTWLKDNNIESQLQTAQFMYTTLQDNFKSKGYDYSTFGSRDITIGGKNFWISNSDFTFMSQAIRTANSDITGIKNANSIEAIEGLMKDLESQLLRISGYRLTIAGGSITYEPWTKPEATTATETTPVSVDPAIRQLINNATSKDDIIKIMQSAYPSWQAPKGSGQGNGGIWKGELPAYDAIIDEVLAKVAAGEFGDIENFSSDDMIQMIVDKIKENMADIYKDGFKGLSFKAMNAIYDLIVKSAEANKDSEAVKQATVNYCKELYSRGSAYQTEIKNVFGTDYEAEINNMQVQDIITKMKQLKDALRYVADKVNVGDKTTKINSDIVNSNSYPKATHLTFYVKSNGEIVFVDENKSTGGIFTKNAKKNSELNNYFEGLKQKLQSSYATELTGLKFNDTEKANLFNAALFMTLSDTSIITSVYDVCSDFSKIVKTVIENYSKLLINASENENIRKYITEYSSNTLLGGRVTSADPSVLGYVNQDLQLTLSNWYIDNSTNGGDDNIYIDENPDDAEYSYQGHSGTILKMVHGHSGDDSVVNASMVKLLNSYIDKYGDVIQPSRIIEIYKNAQELAFKHLITLTRNCDDPGSASIYGHCDQISGTGNDFNTINDGFYSAGSVLLQVMYEMESLLAKEMTK